MSTDPAVNVEKPFYIPPEVMAELTMFKDQDCTISVGEEWAAVESETLRVLTRIPGYDGFDVERAIPTSFSTEYPVDVDQLLDEVRYPHMLKDLSRSTPLEQFLRGEAISTVTFQTIFKQIYGRSPYAYLKHYRMNSAAVQLRESNESINQIALSLGYSNASKFARAFRDVFGVLPKDYRTAQKAI